MIWIAASWSSAVACTWRRRPAPPRRTSTRCTQVCLVGWRPAGTSTRRERSPPICPAASGCAKHRRAFESSSLMIDAVGKPQSIQLLGGAADMGRAVRAAVAARDGESLDEAIRRRQAAGASEVETLPFDAVDFDSHPAVIDKAFEAGDIDIAIVAFGILGDNEKQWQNQKLAVQAAQVN